MSTKARSFLSFSTLIYVVYIASKLSHKDFVTSVVGIL